MALYMVRAGRYGEQEEIALDRGLVAIGWNELPDLHEIKNKEELRTLFTRIYPSMNKNQLANELGQVWRFIYEISIGDYVALPLKKQSSVAIGKIASNYEYNEIRFDLKHTRKADWIKIIPRSDFDQDLLYSLGAYMTVCRIQRNNAESRVKAMINESKPLIVQIEETEESETIDIETYAKDEIRKYIDRKFKGHGLARLVEAVLKSEGYLTRISSPGPDGGMDILASRGPLGFEHPRICVQVKSGSNPVDVSIYRQLVGVIHNTNADQGLLVSWSGFTSQVDKESRDRFFQLRLWDSGDVIDAILQHYDKFDEELKAELPLKNIWSLVHEE